MRTPGKRIRQACEVLEKFGPMGGSSLCDHIDGVESSNMGKYCSRAVAMGLMTVERGLRNRSNYSIFTVTPNWREIADTTHKKEPAERKPQAEQRVAKYSKWFGINSVFSMGGV